MEDAFIKFLNFLYPYIKYGYYLFGMLAFYEIWRYHKNQRRR